MEPHGAGFVGRVRERAQALRAAVLLAVMSAPLKRRAEWQAFLVPGGNVLGKVLGVVFALVGVIVVFTVAAQLAPDVITAIADLVAAFGGNATTNNTVGDVLLSVSGIIVAIVAVIGFLFIILRAAGLGGSGRRG